MPPCFDAYRHPDEGREHSAATQFRTLTRPTRLQILSHLTFNRSSSRAQFNFASPCRTFSGSSRLSKNGD